MRLAHVLVISILLFPSCSDDCFDCGGRSSNDPPRVWLAAGPPEGSTVDNPVHFYWGGWDSDGAVTGFEYLFAQNDTGAFEPADSVGIPWSPVHANDSTFVLTPDSLNTSHAFTFLLRAVDNEGLRSNQVYRSFRVR